MMRRLYAAADLLVMPSMHEACGLTQMEAQTYGVVPVVRRCGGLADTIIAHCPGAANSTGIVFDRPTVADLSAALEMALRLLPTDDFADLRRRCMNAPRSWEAAVGAYERLYLPTEEGN